MKTPAPNPPVLLAAGGTGGHVFPAEALAAELDSRGRRLVLVTDKRGTAFGEVLGRIEKHAISARSPSARAPLARGLAILSLIWGAAQSARLLRRIRPAAVVGFGGYPSVPPLFATTRLGIPSVIHEQNAVLGRANHMLAGRAAAVATSFPETERMTDAQRRRATHTGNPVRDPIAALHDVPYAAPEADGAFNILVTGGSLGAHVFAEIVPHALKQLAEPLRQRIVLSQQCRQEDLAEVRALYDGAGIDATLAPFFTDMPERLGAAHLVICRSGASTIAELAIAGRPAILVPLPIAADDHQAANAQALEAVGAATMIRQHAFTPERLAQEIETLMGDPDDLAKRSAAARSFARPDAARALADLVESVIGRSATTPERAAA